MTSDKIILAQAQKTFDIEAAAVLHLKKTLDSSFSMCVKIIAALKGRVVVTGIGKSALIGQKIVATFNSTGTAAVFMHAADAIHGDLGIIQNGDVVICISNSGNTPEIKVLAPLLKASGNTLIAFTGNTSSVLAKHAHYVLNTAVAKEACPLNLAPTSSTTAQLVMGDALAVCVLELRGFTKKDFARYHPGGALGKRLYLKVGDLCESNAKPQVAFDATINEVIMQITGGRLGAVAVLKNKKLVGIITDGDLRRMLQNSQNTSKLIASGIMNKKPKCVEGSILAAEAFEIMKQHNISQLVILDKKNYVGMVHMHDFMREGIV